MTNKPEKKKKSFLKKLLTYGGISVLVLLIAIIVTPFLFKDQLKDLALKEANKMLKSEVAVGDFDLTFITTFPKLKLTFDNVSITGRDEFDELKLIDLKSLEAKLDFWSVVKMDDISIRSIKLVEPNVYVRILENGRANYDIVKSSEELAAEDVDTTETAFKLSLNNIEIVDGNIVYEDKDTLSPIFAGIEKLNLKGKGDLVSEDLNFKGETTMEQLIVQMGDDLDLNTRNIALSGEYGLNKNVSDFEINTTVEEILMKMAGQDAVIQKLAIEGSGEMGAETVDVKSKTTMDELSYKMDGISYLSKVKTDLDLDLLMEFLEDGYKFNLNENNLKLNALNLSFDGFYEMLEDHSNIDLKLVAGDTKFKDLLSLIPTFYHTGYESMIADGSMNIGGFLKGRLDDNNIPAWNLDANVKNASISYPEMPEQIKNVNITMNTKFPGGSDLDKITVDVDDIKATFAGNTIDGNFYLKYPMSDPLLKSKLNANVDLSTLEKVYPTEEKYVGKLTSDVALEGRLSAIENEDYQNFKASGNLQLQDFVYTSEDLPDPLNIKNIGFVFSPEKLMVSDLKASMGKSNYEVSGELRNYMGYLFKENEDLKGTLNLHTNLLNVDELMGESVTVETEEEGETTVTSEAILVPKNIDFVMNTSVDEIIYDGMNIKNLKGKVKIKDEEATLENLNMNVFDGSVGLNGKYSTKTNKKEPMMDLGWSLKDLDIKSLANQFITIDKLAPIAKFLDGKVSSDFSMTSSLKPDFEPIFNTLTGNGNLFSSNLDIKGFEPLTELAEKLQISKLSQQTLNNIKATFEFKDGKVNMKPFNVKMAGINTLVEGTTSFNQEIDYKMEMKIPKKDIPSQMIELAEKAVAQVNKIPGFKFNLKELPDEIPVTAFVTNTITKPVIKTNLKEKLMELGGNVKDQVKDMVDDKVKEIKDTVQTVIDNKIDDAKEEVEKQKQKILNEAQKQADKLVEEANKLAEKTRAEADKNAQKLIDDAGDNFLKKKGAEVAAKKIVEQGEKSAKKIENEGQSKADALMQKARDKANAL